MAHQLLLLLEQSKKDLDLLDELDLKTFQVWCHLEVGEKVNLRHILLQLSLNLVITMSKELRELLCNDFATFPELYLKYKIIINLSNLVKFRKYI